MAYLFTFLEGIFAFISPCILPMLPIFLGFLSADKHQSVKNRVVRISFFVLGFSTVFVLMGATAFSFAGIFSAYEDLLRRLAGVIMVLFGFIYLDFIQISLPFSPKSKPQSGILGNYLFGVAYAFGWTPCLGAFLGSALALASVQQTLWKGVSLLLAFSLGLGMPFLVFGALYEKLYFATDFLKRHGEKIKLIGGIILIATGIAFVFDLFGYYLRLF